MFKIAVKISLALWVLLIIATFAAVVMGAL
jgi:hypothetical protein